MITSVISIILVDLFKSQVERDDEHQQEYDQMKVLLAKETLLTFPDFNEEFENTQMLASYN